MILRLQHSFQGSSGIPRDQYVNTFYFSGPTLEGGDLPALSNAVQQFYNGTPAVGGGSSVAKYMATLSDTPGARVKIYDMADTEPRVPLYEESYTPGTHGTSSGDSLPTELAVCMSYRGDPAGGVPVERRRGRLYLGPWAQLAGVSSTTTDAYVNPDLMSSILSAAGTLASVSLALGWSWAVHSTAGAFATPITTVWVDNAWDIQRRRGLKATTRQTLVL